MQCFFPRRRSSLPWRPSSYMMISASHGNDDRLHFNDDRLHGHKGLNPFSNIQSRHQSFLLQTNLRRLSFSKMQAFIPFLSLSKQYILISCRSHISVYQQNRKNNIKILNWNILIFWSKEKKQETGVIVQKSNAFCCRTGNKIQTFVVVTQCAVVFGTSWNPWTRQSVETRRYTQRYYSLSSALFFPEAAKSHQHRYSWDSIWRGVSKYTCPRAWRGAAKEQVLSIRYLYGQFSCDPASSAGTR